jgi:hypothetical protein
MRDIPTIKFSHNIRPFYCTVVFCAPELLTAFGARTFLVFSHQQWISILKELSLKFCNVLYVPQPVGISRRPHGLFLRSRSTSRVGQNWYAICHGENTTLLPLGRTELVCGLARRKYNTLAAGSDRIGMRSRMAKIQHSCRWIGQNCYAVWHVENTTLLPLGRAELICGLARWKYNTLAAGSGRIAMRSGTVKIQHSYCWFGQNWYAVCYGENTTLFAPFFHKDKIGPPAIGPWQDRLAKGPWKMLPFLSQEFNLSPPTIWCETPSIIEMYTARLLQACLPSQNVSIILPLTCARIFFCARKVLPCAAAHSRAVLRPVKSKSNLRAFGPPLPLPTRSAFSGPINVSCYLRRVMYYCPVCSPLEKKDLVNTVTM